MKKVLFALIFGLVLSVLFTVQSDSIHADLSDNLIRLHIIANSDSETDQAVKLKVRDRILSEMSVYFKDAKDAGECRKIINNNIDMVVWYANDELKKNGFDYTADAYYGRFEFPTKVYANVTLPKGEYEAVRVVLGKGEGHNWWCVMFPPLCFTNETKGELDSENKEFLKENLNGESYDIITNNGNLDVKIKFKLLELITN